MPSRRLIQINKSGVVNVVNDYAWSISSTESAKREIPTISITEYQQSLSSIQQGIKYWANQAKTFVSTGQTADPYSALYAIDPGEPGNTYVLPFFSPYHHNISNAWGENKGVMPPLVSRGLDIATKIAKAALPSAGIESAKSWEGTTPATYQFSFQLLNTVDDEEANMTQNLAFIYALTHNNLLDKVDFISVRPPALCEVEIPGIRGTTVAVMSNINVENMGQINRIGDRNIPDAYNITITIQELLTESRQIIANELKGGKVFAQVATPARGIDEASAKTKAKFKAVMNKINKIGK